MDEKKTFRASDRALWRAWLEEHYKTEREVWLVFPTKEAGVNSVCYNDAVEEALCFGWIDSTAGKIDAYHTTRRFGPRKPGSAYSRANVERLLWLEAQGLLLPEIKENVKEILETPFVFPADIMEKIKENPTVYAHFQEFSPSYRRIRVAHIDAARENPAEFQKRLYVFLKKTEEGKRIVGFGGCEKYY